MPASATCCSRARSDSAQCDNSEVMDTPKSRILALVEDQPDDSSYDEILHELAFVRMVERGIADADAGRVVSHEEVRRRIDEWSK